MDPLTHPTLTDAPPTHPPVPSTADEAAAPAAPKPFATGDRVDDFDLLALLGEGQFAKVFLARQRTMQRLVALKVSAARGAEAQTLARLDHPNIVRVYDQRTVPDLGVLLVYMPFLAGGTLHDVLTRAKSTPPTERTGRTLLEAVDAALDRRGLIPPAESAARRGWADKGWPAAVCTLGAKLAAALDYAHRQGVLHRDVKPANVLLTSEGEPLLADFNVGSCATLDAAGPAATFGGSLAYMAAEHLDAFNPAHPRSADTLDGRADLFSLAVTLWELVTGGRPFGSGDLGPDWKVALTALADRRRAGPTQEAVAAFPDAVPGFRDVLLRCLDADPDRRPATAGEMARELDLCLRPATRALVRPARSRWRSFVVRHPYLAIYPPGLAPNVLASLFNIEHNRHIIATWGGDAVTVFPKLIQVVNGVFFPVGIALFGWAMWPVARTLRRLRAGEPVAAADLGRARRWALRLGGLTAWVCVGCWAVAGVIWPVALAAIVGPHQQPGQHFHFVASLAVCGMIAAAYPYFIITFLSVRALYPALLGPGGPDPEDGPALARVGKELNVYRGLATAVPFVAIALLAWRGVENATFAMAGLSVAGLAGTALAFVLEGRTRADLAALADIPGSPSR